MCTSSCLEELVLPVTGPERAPYRPDRTLLFTELSLINSTPPYQVQMFHFQQNITRHTKNRKIWGQADGECAACAHEVGGRWCAGGLEQAPQVTLEGTRAVSRAPRPSPGHCSGAPLPGACSGPSALQGLQMPWLIRVTQGF